MLQVYSPAGGIALGEVLSDIFPPANSCVINACCCDSRHVQPGDLFVALEGAEHDGHDFVNDAIRRGATVILSERPLPVHAIPVFIVPDARDAYGRVCQALAGSPADDLSTIGITGTTGKTTTAALANSILDLAGRSCGSLGTLGYSDGVSRAPAPTSTPPAPLLANWLARMTAGYCSHAILEVSSRALSRRDLAGLELDIACVTNITRAHLGAHNTLENYRQLKASIFDLLAEDGLAIVNADDPTSAGLTSKLRFPTLTIGIDRPAEITATVVERNLCHQSFLLSAGDETAAVRTQLLGDHNVYNCLSAAAIGFACGIDLTTIARGLEKVDGLSGRMERVDYGQEFSIFVDEAGTPHGLAAALTALREVCDRRIICVVSADTNDEGSADREGLVRYARTAERLADSSIISASGSHAKPAAWTAAEMQDCFECRKDAIVIQSRKDAIAHAFDIAEPGDVVLLAGRSASLSPKVAGARAILDDREIVKDLLRRCEAVPFPTWRAAA